MRAGPRVGPRAGAVGAGPRAGAATRPRGAVGAGGPLPYPIYFDSFSELSISAAALFRVWSF